MSENKPDSGATAEPKKYWISLYLEDREWIDQTKSNLSRPERLHHILENYRRAGLDAQYSEEP